MSEEVANLLAKRFIARPDVKAIQHTDGAYNPVHSKFTRADLLDHIEGRKTYGHYVLSTDSKCKLFCYDLDLRKEGVWVDDLGTAHEFNPREAWLDPNHPSRQWQTIQLRTLAEALASRVKARLGLGVAIANSGGKGLHVYGFSENPEPAADVRAAAIFILEDFKCFERSKNGDIFWRHVRTDPTSGFPNIEIEVYPKQDSLDGKDLGNLIRLPLGVNRKSGNPAFFLDVACGYDQLKPADPVETLTVMDPWFRDRKQAS